MTKDERARLLKVKVKVMRRAGLTAESVKRNAEISRKKLLRTEEEIKRDAVELKVVM